MIEISPVFTVLGIINTVISMIACPIIAGYKNRSVAGWFFWRFIPRTNWFNYRCMLT